MRSIKNKKVSSKKVTKILDKLVLRLRRPAKEAVHYLLGGSSATIWSECSGYAELVPLIAKKPAGEAAEHGTFLHRICLDYKVAAEVRYLLKGIKVPAIGSIHASWEEHEQYAQDFWDKIFDEVLEGSVTGKRIYIEQLFTMRHNMGGTADLIVIAVDDQGKKYAHIVDLKTGRVRIEPKSKQLLLYAAALYKEVLKKLKIDLSYIKVSIYQPQHDEVFTSHTHSRAKLISAHKRFIKIGQQVDLGKFKYVYGDHCEWCPAKLQCGVWIDNAGEQVGMPIQNLPKVIKNKNLPNVRKMSKEQLTKLVNIREALIDWLDEAKAFVIGDLMRGAKYPDHKLVRGNSKRKWIEDKKLILKTLKKKGVDPFEQKLKALTTIEKEVGSELVNRLTTKPEGQLILVPLSDPREAHRTRSALDDIEEDEY